MTPLIAASMYWHLPLLLVVLSIVFSATRYDRWDMIFKEALRWGVRMIIFLFCIGAVLYGVSSL